MTVEQRIQIEKGMTTKIVDDALALGYTISVHDSAEWTVKKSHDREEILAALMTTDDDLLRFRTAGGDLLGSVWLVYGNSGWDVICDHTDTPAMCALLAGAFAMGEEVENDRVNR